jgi:hypothetical protein
VAKGKKRRTYRDNKSTNTDKGLFELQGKILETYPAGVFGVEITRKAGLAPLIIKAVLHTALKKSKKRSDVIIRGDLVRVEINPEELASDDPIKGMILGRVQINRPPVETTK